MANIFFVPCQPKLAMKHHRPCWHQKTLPKLYSIIRNQKTSSFSYKSTSNVPFYELPGASFDEYLENKQRVRQAVLFSDKVTTEKLNEEEWRIKLPPIQNIFLNVQPTADVRLTFKSNGLDYPNEIPHHITKILQIHIIKWEIEGPFHLEARHLSLDIKGAIYPERIGRKSWLKNQMEMKISFCAPPTMSIVPENVMQGSVKLVFRTILDEMKKDFQGKLLADYSKFKKNKSIKNLV